MPKENGFISFWSEPSLTDPHLTAEYSFYLHLLRCFFGGRDENNPKTKARTKNPLSGIDKKCANLGDYIATYSSSHNPWFSGKWVPPKMSFLSIGVIFSFP